MKTPQLVFHVLLIYSQETKPFIITFSKFYFLQKIKLDPLDIFLFGFLLTDFVFLVLLIEVADLIAFFV